MGSEEFLLTQKILATLIRRVIEAKGKLEALALKHNVWQCTLQCNAEDDTGFPAPCSCGNEEKRTLFNKAMDLLSVDEALNDVRAQKEGK